MFITSTITGFRSAGPLISVQRNRRLTELWHKQTIFFLGNSSINLLAPYRLQHWVFYFWQRCFCQSSDIKYNDGEKVISETGICDSS